MMSLSVTDWMTVVQLIYRINCIEEYDDYFKEILGLVHITLDFSSAVFCEAEQKENMIVVNRMEGFNISDEDMASIKEHLSGNAFITGLCLDLSGSVTRGPIQSHFDLKDSRVVPKDLSKAMSMVLYHKERLLGFIILWQNEAGQEFNTRDICAFGVLRNHISLQMHKLRNSRITETDGRYLLEREMQQFHLSKREVEILFHLTEGLNDSQVCEILYISPSTFKKHLNHIYEKMKVSSRVQLLKTVEENKRKNNPGGE
ncbi:helix-turn-helix transcriptional regulator [Lachnospiraceae bacterium 54-53]